MSESNGIVWEDPPPSKSTGKYAPLLEELRANPGRWALVRSGDEYTKVASAAQYLLSFEGIQVTRRKTPGGGGAVYARFVPEEENEKAPTT